MHGTMSLKFNILLYATISISQRTASKVEGLFSAVVHTALKATVQALTLYFQGICLEELSKATIDSVQKANIHRPKPGVLPTKLCDLTSTPKYPTPFNSYHRAHTGLKVSRRDEISV